MFLGRNGREGMSVCVGVVCVVLGVGLSAEPATATQQPSNLVESTSAQENESVAAVVGMLELRIREFREELDRVNDFLASVIVMTEEQDCSSLGSGWRRYEDMEGRFPIGAGLGTDVNGATREFRVGQNDTHGEYQHLITIAEMPTHDHSYLTGGGTGPSRCGGDCRRRPQQARQTTSPSGSNQPHNNIPPLHVVNFCVR